MFLHIILIWFVPQIKISEIHLRRLVMLLQHKDSHIDVCMGVQKIKCFIYNKQPRNLKKITI